MHLSTFFTRVAQLFAPCLLMCLQSFAHNGTIGYAYPLNNIVIDGNFSDWPKDIQVYHPAIVASEIKPHDKADFDASFRIGYREANHSLYLAVEVTDDDFIEDTSANVRWNSQDAFELYLDARHLPFGSGVASFMYSKKLRNTNNAYFDPFAKNANWNMIEVAMKVKDHTRYYEWRINLGDQFEVGKSIGLDFNLFDMDADKSFSYTSWGTGEMKYINPRSLCDVVLMPAHAQLAGVSGKISWDAVSKVPLPSQVQLIPPAQPQQWVTVLADSLGNYSAQVPAGSYNVTMSKAYYQHEHKVYAMVQQQAVTVKATAGKKAIASTIVLPASPVPDLLPEKGLLLHFDSAAAKQVDHFIETYQQYYEVPGVSLALIKDGRLVYHKTYGVRNTFTKQPVDSNTLFEAASVTKPVFAFAVQRLAERGVIHLDTPLYRYLPYPDIAYDERYKLITAKHVLTHRTGFPNWRSMNADGKLNLKFTPGTDYNYSGEGFEYLKMVIEKVTGKKVEQVLQEEVIQPVGLYHTFFSRNDSLRRMVAEGHVDMLPNYDELPESPGMAWSMHTEAKIFTRFMLYMLEQKGLKASTYDSMLTKHSDFHFDPGEEKPKYPSYMGMSLEIRETAFGKSFGHGGNNGDFKCHFEVYKESKMGYVIFTNSNTSDVLMENLRKVLVEGKD